MRSSCIISSSCAISSSPSDRMGEFAALFGEIEGNVFRNPDGSTLEAIHEISNLDAEGRPAENPYLKSNYHWHTDKAYLPVPALLTMLHAIELPQSGGDTQFADMTRAYDALSDDDKRRIADLRVVHSLEYMRESTGDRPPTDAERAAAPPVTHPLVRTHPQTGEKSLFLGMYCSHVVGMATRREPRVARPAPCARDAAALRLYAPLAARRPRLLGQPLPAASRGGELRHGQEPPGAAAPGGPG